MPNYLSATPHMRPLQGATSRRKVQGTITNVWCHGVMVHATREPSNNSMVVILMKETSSKSQHPVVHRSVLRYYYYYYCVVRKQHLAKPIKCMWRTTQHTFCNAHEIILVPLTVVEPCYGYPTNIALNYSMKNITKYSNDSYCISSCTTGYMSTDCIITSK